MPDLNVPKDGTAPGRGQEMMDSRLENRALVARVEETIRDHAEAWCNGNPGGANVGRYLQEFLHEQAKNVSSGHPLGLGAWRVLAGWALLRLIAGTHRPDRLERTDFDSAVSRISNRMPRERNPLFRQAMEHYAELAWPKVWDEFEADLEFLPDWAQEIVLEEAAEIVAALRESRGKRTASTRPKPETGPYATHDDVDWLDDMIRQVMSTPVGTAPASDAEKAPDSEPGRKRGHLQRVV